MDVPGRSNTSIVDVVMMCVVFSAALVAHVAWNRGDEINFHRHNAIMYKKCHDPLFASDLGHVCEDIISRHKAPYSPCSFVAWKIGMLQASHE